MSKMSPQHSHLTSSFQFLRPFHTCTLLTFTNRSQSRYCCFSGCHLQGTECWFLVELLVGRHAVNVAISKVGKGKYKNDCHPLWGAHPSWDNVLSCVWLVSVSGTNTEYCDCKEICHITNHSKEPWGFVTHGLAVGGGRRGLKRLM